MFFPHGYSYEKKLFYQHWELTGFDPKRRNECLAKAGYAKSTIAREGKKREREVHEMISHEMDRQGMTMPYLVKKHKQQLNAMHPFRPEMPDHQARGKALDMAYQIRDAYPRKIEVEMRREIAIKITLDSLRAAEQLTGEKIIDIIPEEAIESINDESGRERVLIPEHTDDSAS